MHPLRHGNYTHTYKPEGFQRKCLPRVETNQSVFVQENAARKQAEKGYK